MILSNLKITVFLEDYSPVLLNRFTTIDSILLSAYYGYKAKKGEPLPFDEDHKTVDFIEKKNGVFSGSIWYIDRTQKVFLDFHQITKKPEYEKLYEKIKAKMSTNSSFKQALIQEEIMLTKKIHFYIRGSKKHIEALLYNEVKSIGSKQKLGFGAVKDIKVEEIEEDRGFCISSTTPSKPLPVDVFDIKSKKVAFFRRSAPYWKKEGLEPCYMPTTALYEVKDNTAGNKKFKSLKDIPFVSNCDFIYDQAKNFKGFEECHESIKKIKALSRKGEFFELKEGERKTCSISGSFSTFGVYNNSRVFIKKWKKGFSDYGDLSHNDFISYKTLWCIHNFKDIGYSLVESEDKHWKYLQGKDAKKGDRINDYIIDISRFKPPFSINLKDTINPQHVEFKGKVSISNAFFYLQYGAETLQIDGQMLQEAIEDIATTLKTSKNVTKTHLCGNFKDAMHPRTKKDITLEEIIVIENFHKKYDRQLRYLLNVVAF